ncbi:response regulator [Chlorogloeopsis sp. ULAP01]|uniref:response regulator n=1 Tax=Chlorogloeopsis sp. ULAP01 TaxID=3056483 RepID=UPI0025AB0B4F|nr:response regulator [Chlorogloeopsis sp. ULAP01]MDM9383814.1 response regulator [Chlorogloeopsis sp. ULAP01]
MKILLIEDDPSVAQFLANALTAYRYTVDTAADGQLGLELANQGEYGAILLDLMVPKIDGLSLCRHLRRQGCQTPILILTAKDSDEDIVTGLDAGADVYVTKPCEPSQLIARIRALLRRQGSAVSSPVLKWGALCLDPGLIQVTYQQQIITLSPKEYSLLELFLRHPQRIFSRSAIIDHLWSIDESPTDAAVTNLIKDLRRRLKSAGIMEDVIETVYRLGYRLRVPPLGDKKQNEEKVDWTQQQENYLRQEGLVLFDEALQDFQASLEKRLEVLDRAKTLLQLNHLDSSEREQVVEEAHRLAGGLGTFGYIRGSELARSLEHLFVEETLHGEQLHTQFSYLLEELKQEIAKPPTYSTSNTNTPQTGSTPLVLVIDDDNSFLEALRQEAKNRGFRVDVASRQVNDWHWEVQQPPSVIVLSLHSTSMQENELSVLQNLKSQFPATPVLVLAKQDRLDERVTLARFRNVRYLLKPTIAEDLFKTITKILAQNTISDAKVMVVDDDPIVLKTLTALLQPCGLQVTTVPHPEMFWHILKFTDPDVLLLDLKMPTFDGIDLCRVVRQDSAYADLPIVVVTAHTDIDSIQQALAAGADDFLCKPIVGSDLVTRVINRIERSRSFAGGNSRSHQQQLKLPQDEPQTLQSEVNTDSLTKVASGQYFYEFLAQVWQRLSREQAPLSLILCDVDNFTSYNDSHGFQAGNFCLQQIANAVKECINPNSDLVARYGGDKFAIVLPNSSPNAALQIVEQIQHRVANLQIPHNSSNPTRQFAVSLGVTSTIPTQEKSLQNAIAIATQALYAAKSRGGNTYCLYPS